VEPAENAGPAATTGSDQENRRPPGAHRLHVAIHLSEPQHLGGRGRTPDVWRLLASAAREVRGPTHTTLLRPTGRLVPRPSSPPLISSERTKRAIDAAFLGKSSNDDDPASDEEDHEAPR